MKKILLGLIMLATAATINAQIELEHTIIGGMPPQNRSNWQQVGMDDYYITFAIVNTISGGTFFGSGPAIYDSNMNLVFSADEYDEIYLFAKNVFTTDGRLCFVKLVNNEGSSYYIKDAVILDIDGNVLKTISSVSANVPPFLIKMRDGYKLIVNVPVDEGPDETHIYSCPGNGEGTTSVENVPAKVKRNAYPNPASDLVTLPYEVDGATSMKIYDMQGKLVERKFLDKNKQELQLNVKDYPSGMYFFEVNGESNSFIVD